VRKPDAFTAALLFSTAFHFSFLLIPAFRSIQGDIDPRDYKIVQLMDLETAQPQARPAPKPDGDISVSKDSASNFVPQEKPQPEPETSQGDGQFSLYLPFFKVMKLPEFITRVKPVYPAKAKLQGAESEVIIEVYIDAEGRPRKTLILRSGGEEFDKATADAISQSSFSPAISKEGKPVPVRVRIPFKFELD